MNYDNNIYLITERIKTDKTIMQPWRNKAVARMQEAQAFIRMGQTSTNRPDSPNRVDAAGVATTGDMPIACTCPHGAVDSNCPIHGGKTA